MSQIDWMERAIAQAERLHPYVTGKPIEILLAEQGISQAIKLASNENPFGAPPKAVAAITKHAAEVSRYPDGDSRSLKELLANKHGVASENILIGNGSSEVLELVIRCFAGSGDEVLFSSRAFIMYSLYARAAGAIEVAVPESDGLTHDLDAMAAAITQRTKVVCIANPNNPTGTVHNYAAIQGLLDRVPDNVVVLLDEAYYEFMDEADRQGKLSHPGLIICRTFSKAFGLAGCRIGYGVGDAEILRLVNRFRPPFNANVLAQKAALAALDDDAWVMDKVAKNNIERSRLEVILEDLGVLAGPSFGNFVLLQHSQASLILQKLEAKGIIPRPLAAYGMPDYLRITVGREEENDLLLSELPSILAEMVK
ncbi:MAG: histidinol-phosphate transaminase [Mariprofundaceae bacterium]|nr:histidinol-phosphate transaminase [Mariprofundaceae bacterium]